MTTLVLGLGNRDRGDDAAGLEVAVRLAGLGLPATVRTWEGTDLDLPLVWAGHDHVVLVDASSTGAPAGTLQRLDPSELARRRAGSAGPAGGTHAFGLAEVLAFAARLDRLPPRLELWTVEVAAVAHGTGLSPPVARGVDRLVAELVAELAPEREADLATGPAAGIAAGHAAGRGQLGASG